MCFTLTLLFLLRYFIFYPSQNKAFDLFLIQNCAPLEQDMMLE